jgi:hypothetical protein
VRRNVSLVHQARVFRQRRQMAQTRRLIGARLTELFCVLPEEMAVRVCLDGGGGNTSSARSRSASAIWIRP